MAERETGAIDLADKRAAAADLGHKRRLTKAHLTHALAKIAVASEFTNPPKRTSGQLAKWEERRCGWNGHLRVEDV